MPFTRAVTAPRIIVPGATISVTRRTVMRKAFLAPWHPLVPKVWLYALADAQLATGVAVHHAICVVTHHHLTVTAEAANLPEFVQRLHHDTSCALNTLLASERYDAPGQLFDGRSAHYMRLLDAPAQASQLVYEHLNCVAAGLVSRPEHMPGARFDFELWRKGYLDVERPPIFFSDDRPEHVRLFVTPPPLLFAAFGGDLDRLVYHMKRASDDAARTLRAARRRPPLGARRVERLHPWSEPRTLRETGGARIPTFRIGARGLLGYDLSVAAAIETREYRHEYHDAWLARRSGDPEHCFPYGAYQVRLQHGAPVAPGPKATALVTAPGPLLCDVQAALAGQTAPSTISAQTIDLLNDLRAAIEAEATQLCEHSDLDFEHDADAALTTRGDASPELRPSVLLRHRFDHPLGELQARYTRKLIVLRDRRRGRPPNATRHGSDPPA